MKSKILILLLLCVSFSLGFLSIAWLTSNDNTDAGVNELKITKKVPKDKIHLLSKFKAYKEGGMNCPMHPIYLLADSIINYGSKDANTELTIYYLDLDFDFAKMFSMTLLMANKFDSSYSYGVYGTLRALSNNMENNLSLDNLDVKTRRMAIEYLKIAADNGLKEAKETMALYIKQGKYINE
ncbi:MAG: hypothetical protein H6Q14_2888 [Bacteroidetes bacterium]|nr:hypothetical protein [Bacteroidota bacterium]